MPLADARRPSPPHPGPAAPRRRPRRLIAACVAAAAALGPSPGLAQDGLPLADVAAIGSGTSGSAGVPTLHAVGLPAIGQPGPGLVIGHGPPGAPAQILVGAVGAPTPLPGYGATLYPAAPLARLPVALGADGASAALFQTPQPSAPALSGLEFVAQALVADAAAQGGAAFTAGVRLRFGAGLAGAGIFDLTAHHVVPGAFKTASPALAVGDVDGNGRPDVVVPAGTGSVTDLRVLRQLADGTLAPPLAFPLDHVAAAVDVLLADLDDDGILDAVTAHAGASGSAVQRLRGLGDGSFGAPDVLGPAPGGAAVALAAGDLSGDGRADLVVAGWTASSVAVLVGPIGVGPAVPDALVALPAPPVARGARLGDVDADGRLDLLVLVDGGAPQVLVARSLGGGAFAPPVAWPVALASAAALAVADLDGDGDADALVAAAPAPGGTSGAQDLMVLLSDGAGGATAGPPVVLPPWPVAPPVDVRLGDLDGNALPDLLVTWGSFGGIGLSLPGLGGGAFGPALTVDHTGTTSRLADMDGDGRLDLVTLTVPFLLSRVSWQKGDGALGFELPPPLPTGMPLGPSRAADLDGDGDLDLVAWPYAGTQPPAVSVALNDGAARFAPVVAYATGGSVRDVAIADVDADGVLDLVAAGSLGASVLPGIGDGTFGTPVLVGQPATRLVRVADTDADGLPELILGSTALPPALRVVPNLGGLAFGAPVPTPLVLAPDLFDVGDLDGDGFPEAVVQAGHGVLRLAGTGTPAFSPPVLVTDPLAGSGNATPVVLADVDGDGALDMVRRTSLSGTTEIWRNDGTGALAIGQWAFWEAFEAPTVIDVNGDGAVDVVGEGVMLGLGGGQFAEPVPGAAAYVHGDLDGDGRPDGAAYGHLFLNRLP